MRNFNIDQQFAEIQKAANEAAKEIFPVVGRNRSVIMEKSWVEDNLASDDFSAQAKTKSKEGTYGVPLYAHLKLIDNQTKEVIDENQKLRLFLLPKITERFSYIVKGNEYQVTNQLRLKPGVYTLQKQNGELKTQVNLAKGKNFDIVFNDKKNLFYIAKVGGGQANIPLYPTLISLGMSPQSIEKAWGQQLAAANAIIDQKVDAKLKTAFGVKSGSIKDYFNNTQIDPQTTKEALGTSFDRVDGPLLLAASTDLLKTHKGEKDPTDRDSLQYKDLYSVEDFIKERLQKNKQSLEFKIKRNVNTPTKTKLTQIVNPATFGSVVESFFTGDDKSATPEQTNPLEMLTGQYKATIMGSGGIKQEHAVTDNMREVHPTHYGFMDPIHSPESKRIGANMHIPMGAIKDGKDLKTIVLDKNKKPVALTPTELFNKKVVFPGQTGETVKALYQGQQIMIKRSEADYETPSSKALFSTSTNLIPFLPSNQGNRAMMAAKQMEQAIALKYREAPLVQVSATKDKSMEQSIGENFVARKAPADGIVKEVTPDYISIQTSAGIQKVSLYNNFTLNRKSFLHHDALVKVGDRVTKDQVIADSNYTKNGTLALGSNFKVAYLPYKGLNFEDGIVITEKAAEKLTSEHIHKKTMDINDNTILKLAAFKAIYPNTLTSQNLTKLDETGVIKKGATVRHGEALIAALRKTQVNVDVALLKKQLADRPKDYSLYWPYEEDGLIMDIQRNSKQISIFVKTEEKAKIGDKLAGRMGNKGIITKIIPDSQAPRNADGEVPEIILNPHGVISRINIGQIYESAAGKAALKMGKPIQVENFSGEDYLKTTNDLMKKAKVDDKEELFDPDTGKSLGKVHVGNPYLLKLYKQSTVNYSARQGGPGTPYDVNHQPLKAGGEEGSKSLDLLTMYSMLSHGARANLREMSSVKGNKNDEYWKALKSGQQLPPPATPYVYDKFMEYLKASGIDTRKEGSRITLAPLTDKQIGTMSKGEVKDPRFYAAKDMKPIKNGFFDQSKFGGFQGEGWGHIELKEPVINPVFENAVKKITGLGSKVDDIMAGKLFVDNDGQLNNKGSGVTGGYAMEKLLTKIDVKKEIAAATAKAKNATGTTLDNLNKQLRYLKSLEDIGISPAEAYLRKKLPIIPPKYRPVYPSNDGQMMTSDANYIYGNVGVINKMMELPVMDLLPEEDKAVVREDLYKHVKAVSGLTDLNIKGKEREGFISEIKGGSGQPKGGFFISKVLSKKQDFVGRGTIIPEPDLGVDEIGVPKQMAWKLFEPFLVRELKNHGKTPIQAMEEIKRQTPLARKALDVVMVQRHVLLNRAPSLHKFSIMAFKPKLTEGKAIKIPPLVTSGFNADFDGDSILGTHNLIIFDGEKIVNLSLFELCEMVGVSPDRFECGKGVFQVNLHNSNLKVLAINPKSGLTEFQTFTAITLHYDHKKTYKVTTIFKREIVVSEDHSLITMDGKGKFKTFIPKKGECQYCIVPKKINLVDSTDKGLTYNFGFLIGLLSSDGTFVVKNENNDNKNYFSVRWHTTEFEVKIKTEESLLDLGYAFHSRTVVRDDLKDLYIIEVYGKESFDQFLKLCGRYSNERRLPLELILNSNELFRQGMLSGVMSGDGGCHTTASNQTSISLKVMSEEFCRSMEILLQSLGVSFTRPYKSQKNRSNLTVRMPIPKNLVGPVQTCRKKTWEQAKLATKTKFDTVPFDGAGLKILLKKHKILVSKSSMLHHILKKGTVVTRLQAIRFVKEYHSILENSEYKLWADIILNENIQFEKITKVDDYETPPVMFDITVPESETFFVMWSVLSKNTMTLHLPISDAANKEAESMLPSNNLYKPGSGKLMLTPTQEAQLGIYYLSKTPQGRVELDKILPPKYNITSVLDKKSTGELLANVSKEVDNKTFARIVEKLKAAGEGKTYDMGFTLGMNDLMSFKTDRDKIVKTVAGMVAKSKDEKELAVVTGKAKTLIDDMISTRLKNTNNPLYDMVESGARGSKDQLRQILATPLLVTDAKQRTVRSVIQKSYSEGLDIGDYWTSMYGARRGMMDRALQTSLPGAFSKDIMATTIDNVITKDDCGIQKGHLFKLTDKDLLGRFLAKDQYGFARNTLVDTKVINDAKKKNIETLEARTPLECFVGKGTCSHCYGLDEFGQRPSVGDNVGAKAGQTISEPLVQLIMNSFHTGGTAGSGSDATGFKRIEQLLHMPKIVTGAAPLASVAGIVTKIEPGMAGGFDVWIGTKKEHVPQGKALKVKVGDKVERGAVLSEGVIRPQDLVKLRGMSEAQRYVTDELHAAYKNQGVSIDKKIFETVVRSAGNYTRVVNNPKDSSYVPGDIASYTSVREYNSNLEKLVPIDEAVGRPLAKDYGVLAKGHEVSEKDVKLLKAQGLSEVRVLKDAVVHTPILKGVTSIPILRQDWMAALGYRNLSKVLTEGASQGWSTDTQGHHPIPAFAKGTTFGLSKEDGKY